MSKHVFISYSHIDSNIADKIANALNRAEVPFFIDKIALQPGDSLTSKIGHGLEAAKALIVLISESSVSSKWVLNEIITVKEQGTQVVPFRCDTTVWPAQLRLLLGDPLYLDGAGDFHYAVGLVPKLFPKLNVLAPEGVKFRQFFPLRKSEAFCPHIQIFDGTLQTAWEHKQFGRVGIVFPTDQSINLLGKVTTSFLNHLEILTTELQPSHQRITSRQVAVLKQDIYSDLVMMAGTVFNAAFEPHAEDQWRAANAILDCADQHKCSLVLVPPMGTGSFDWPVRQATVNWLYGAITWCQNNVTATNRSVWPVICVPGPGDQRIVSYYLNSLSSERIAALERGKFTVKVRYQGVESDEIQVNHDVLLGAIAKSAFAALKTGNHRFCHGAKLVRKRSGQLFEYHADTPLAKTIFADGDIIEVY